MSGSENQHTSVCYVCRVKHHLCKGAEDTTLRGVCAWSSCRSAARGVLASGRTFKPTIIYGKPRSLRGPSMSYNFVKAWSFPSKCCMYPWVVSSWVLLWPEVVSSSSLSISLPAACRSWVIGTVAEEGWPTSGRSIQSMEDW